MLNGINSRKQQASKYIAVGRRRRYRDVASTSDLCVCRSKLTRGVYEAAQDSDGSRLARIKLLKISSQEGREINIENENQCTIIILRGRLKLEKEATRWRDQWVVNGRNSRMLHSLSKNQRFMPKTVCA
jgi:redox-sensitive bicupin YhaK (pirin superfamily)